ncbi:MAG: UDP-N-acetylmuramoyl-L-alanyl-D-glutamate--2,6-diaminopimelate ligase [Desulfobacterales bacterium]|nr:UDP-N-acetylmuramoyl-L-alanyl-D-glutamate--2,6-diaminopimelate ligase [Desulfobacterales bacterium]
MKLAHLIAALRPTSVSGLAGEGPDVASIHYSSRTAAPGGLFVALRGLNADGHDFAAQAVERGAVAVVAEKAVATAVPVVLVASTRRALAELADRFYGQPSAAMTVVAVTGTNGKTTTTYLIEAIFKQAGLSAGLIGTIETRYAGRRLPSPVTTPESLDLQRILGEMRAAGTTHVVLEASSHAIDLARIHCCRMDAAVFTNLSQDHLDYHGDMAAYWATKKRLFTEYLASGPKASRATAVVNTDHAHGRELADAVRGPVIRVGQDEACTVRGVELSCSLTGIRGAILLPGGRLEFSSPLVGRHNIENILCAAGAGVALGIPAAAIRAGIDALALVPGRLERVGPGGGRHVYVDYSHTPDALENALSALRALGARRIICVFGCGGDRDRSKRPLMGEIAGRLSELAVATSDNPRSEAPMAIIAEIVPGLRRAGARETTAAETAGPKHFVVEPDRRRAIAIAIAAARPGDTVLIAGKGHETYQAIGGRTIHFDDREEAAAVLKKLEAESMAHGA